MQRSDKESHNSDIYSVYILKKGYKKLRYQHEIQIEANEQYQTTIAFHMKENGFRLCRRSIKEHFMAMQFA